MDHKRITLRQPGDGLKSPSNCNAPMNAFFSPSDPLPPGLSGSPSREEVALTLNARFGGLDPLARLRLLGESVEGSIVFTTSFGLEDQALTHLIVQSGIDARFATLDTGRLFPEAYEVWAATEERYAIRIQGFHPDTQAVEAFVAAEGVNGFYRSPEARKACCNARKVLPLARALHGAAAWITGMREDQSEYRQGLAFVTHEASRSLIKANPLFDWPRERVAALVADQAIPANSLHARGFLSIGCAPCTRALQPGEPERAGRWWWETEAGKECGLHVSPDGRLVPNQARESQPA